MVTILDEDLRACEASVNGCHVQGALPFFALYRVKEKQNITSEYLILSVVQRS